MNAITRTVNVEDVTKQSKERLNARVAAVEVLAVAHNERVAGEDEAKRRREELEAELSELTAGLVREHKAKHDAAVKAGWTTRDLRAMGLDVPTKPAPKRRRKPAAAPASPPASETTDEQRQASASGGNTSFEAQVEHSA